MTQKILPVYSNAALDENIKVLNASYNAGLRRVEFTNRHDNAIAIFKSLMQHCIDLLPGMKLGAGTIMNTGDAALFTEHGAAFLVSPLISQQLIDYTLTHGIEWIPGCATGAEIGMAQNAGIALVKLFPISSLGGPDFIKSMKGPFYKMKFQASGGIKGDPEEVKALLDAGADIVGLGNSFFQSAMSEEEMTAKIKALLQSI
jgi:2-dehydro-3-deoxyphosphogluconate aldolase / (4S)-4-hydroxy-2-oxoglutarate aldolase